MAARRHTVHGIVAAMLLIATLSAILAIVHWKKWSVLY